MKQQENDFEKRVVQWVRENGFKFNSVSETKVHLERLSDGYKFEVNVQLLDRIMDDEGY